MIRIEVQPKRGETTLHLDENGVAEVSAALDEAATGNKVFLGDPGAMLIVRLQGFAGEEEQVDLAADRAEPGDVAEAWSVLQAAEFAASSDELALLATWEAMRLMLVSTRDEERGRGRDGMRGLLQITLEALREHAPEALDRLVAQWKPQADRHGLEW